jgi:tetratricopeptide (TPR) repeat protein
MSDSLRQGRSTDPTDLDAEPVTSPTVPAVPAQSSSDSTPESDGIHPTRINDGPVRRPPADLPVVFPGYEILGELGRGGMGVVYRARQRSLNRPVALKVILAGPHASDADRARFKLEAEAGARLHHPNIAEVYDVGEHAGFAYIAFELIEGQTLRQWQAGRPADPRTVARLIADLARALQHAHESGIVHRDIKPANILLTERVKGEGSGVSQHPSSLTPHPLPLTPKVTDFGLAKQLQGGPELTVTGMACGTPNYMSPEQIRGQLVGPWSDVYGLGAVLYELLTGHPPFRGADAARVMESILLSDPARARRVNPDAPRDLEVIAAKCLEKDPARRYVSAAELADDLDRFLAGRPIHARAVGLAERTWRWCRRNPVATGFLAASTLGCVVAGWMALALAESAAVERQARADAEKAHWTAVANQKEAERARDASRAALAKEAAAHKQADAEKAAAQNARTDAENARKQADVEKADADRQRDRANGNLKLARSFIRNTFRDLNDNPRIQGPEFREFRESLLGASKKFYKEFAAQAGDDPEAISELADCAQLMGYLESLNGNFAAAADHYQTAADVCYRWVAIDPNDPEARARMAYSLMRSGDALEKAGQFDRVEPRYRDAVALLTWVADHHPRNESYNRLLVRAYAPLYEFLREQHRWADGAALCREYLDRARELVRRIGPKVEYVLIVARAHQFLGQMLDRTGQAEEAECHLLEAVAIRERLRAQFGWGETELKAEMGRLWYAIAQHYAFFANLPHKAPPPAAEAVRLMEEACRDEPLVRNLTMLADCCTLEGELFRANSQFKPAETRYDRAIALCEQVLAKKPTPAEARAAKTTWAGAMTGRAHVYNMTQRHREAIEQWKRLAAEDPNEAKRPGHELFVLQSLVFAKDWRAAAAGAEKLAEGDRPANLLADVARVWCGVSLLAAEDEGLPPAERVYESERAIKKALTCLERAKAAGLFKNPVAVDYYDRQREFDPVRGRFNPRD